MVIAGHSRPALLVSSSVAGLFGRAAPATFHSRPATVIKDTVIFCSSRADFNRLEWRGRKVFVDGLPEIWEAGISGDDEHLNCEYFDAGGDGRMRVH